MRDKIKLSYWRFLFFLLLAVLLVSPRVWAAKEPTLPAKYDHWLKEEVPYLITDEERSEFLSLPNDETRDRFIETFWKVRNPNPESPLNTFKEEHYRRMAYANQHFGASNTQDGWRTDRGMVYITLGPPQQREVHPETKYLRPLEVWFYENTSSDIPPHFYVVFYKPSPAEEYRLYSPYGDRPEKLINSTNAVNNQPLAYQIIQKDLGSEIARLSLSLLPGEPIDPKEAYPSLQSDVLLNNIRNYRNLPTNKSKISLVRAQLEGVTHKIILGEQFSELTTVAMRDAEDRADLHYLFRFRNPQDFTLGKQSDGRYYYSLAVEAELQSANGKVLYKDEQQLSEPLTEQQISQLKNQCFGLEGKLPIAPGKYELHLAVTNNLTKQVYRQSRQILIPAFDHPLGISQVFFADARHAAQRDNGLKPFSFSGIKLSPLGADGAVVSQGTPLRVVFQLWEAPGSPVALHGQLLNLNYLIGQLGSTEKQSQDQVIDRSSFSPAGNLLMGKDLPTEALVPGHYRLVIRTSTSAPEQTAYQSLNFEVAPASTQIPTLWTVDLPSSTDAATDLYRRALCALANNNAQLAAAYLEKSVTLSPQSASLYRALAEAYRAKGDTASAQRAEQKLAEISSKN